MARRARIPDKTKAQDGCISLPQAARIAHLPPTTLAQWVTSGLVEPSSAANVTPGIGVHRRFDLRDLTAICVIAELREQGINVRKLRRVQAALRDYGKDFASAKLALIESTPSEPADVVIYSSDRERGQAWTSVEANPGQNIIVQVFELKNVDALSRRSFAKALREKPAVRGRKPGAKSAPNPRKAAAG